MLSSWDFLVLGVGFVLCGGGIFLLMYVFLLVGRFDQKMEPTKHDAEFISRMERKR